MKHDWEYKKLGEVCEIVSGSTPKTNVSSYWNGQYPWITPVELDGSKYIDKTERNITDEALKHTKLKLLPIGTVLLSSRAPIGKLAITKVPMYCNQGFKNVIVGDGLCNEFVYWYLSFKKDYIVSLGRGATFKEISKSITEQIPIPVPPLPIQQQIVAELDKVSEIIEKKKQQVKELDNLAQSLFYDMFGDPVENEKGWEVKFVKELGEVKIGPFGSLLHKSDYITGGIPLVNPIQMKGDRILTDSDFTVSKEKAEELSSYLLKKGDFVFARRGEIGRCAIVGAEEDGCICGTGSLFVRFKSTIDKLYLLYAVKSKSFSSYLIDQAKGATMLNINCGIVERLEIPTPPLPLQQSFAQKIEAIERQKELITASIKEAQTLFDARMDYWFGE